MVAAANALPNLVQWTREQDGDEVEYRFGNGLVIRTEVFHKRDPMRILPLGGPQGAMMNHLLAFPDRVRSLRVFEPFAGSGGLGFLALKAGALHVDFLDVNPRAVEFQDRNAQGNGFGAERFDAIEGDIATFTPVRPYDFLLANPPFVPTPEGIAGTLTSNGGADGNRFVEILLQRLEALLAPGGQGLIYVMQIEVAGRPLVADLIETTITDRDVELTPSQLESVPFDAYTKAYHQLFPQDVPAVEAWRTRLVERHGPELSIGHYVLDVGPRRDGPGACTILDNFAEKFGPDFLVPSERPEEIAFGRVFENVVPGD